jgi:hypothetical protein
MKTSARGKRHPSFLQGGLSALALGCMSLIIGTVVAPAGGVEALLVVEDVTYDSVYYFRGFRVANVHLIARDGAHYRTPKKYWPEGLGGDDLVVQLRADSVATLWLHGAGGDGYPTITGLRTEHVEIDPERSLRIQRRDSRLAQWLGVLLMVVGLGILAHGWTQERGT